MKKPDSLKISKILKMDAQKWFWGVFEQKKCLDVGSLFGYFSIIFFCFGVNFFSALGAEKLALGHSRL